MKEVTFIKRNKLRWEKFEQTIVSQKNVTPDELGEQYIELTDDLAYSRTFFPKSNMTSYLNGLALKTHQIIYRTKKEKSSRIKHFILEELPLVSYSIRQNLFWSFVVFIIAIGVGVVSALYDDGFVRLILGDGYVNMTLDNIEKGNPMGVYGQMDTVTMFFGITINNIKVAFIAFLVGVFTPAASVFLLFRNGLMVGAFQTFFYNKALLAMSSLAIMIHGSLELSAIVIAGGAGMELGKGWMFPGTYSRQHSFIVAAKRGTKMLLGLVPVFIVAGFLESFITRHYLDMSLFLNLIIILFSFVFILGYFVIYPHMLHKREN